MIVYCTAALEASDRLPLSGASSVDRSGRSPATLHTSEFREGLEATAGSPVPSASPGGVAPTSPSLQTLLEFEYGALHVDTGTVFRAGMSMEQAARWLSKWDESGRSEAFSIIRRQVGPWETP